MKTFLSFALTTALLCGAHAANAEDRVSIADITQHRTAKDEPRMMGRTVTVTGVVLDDPIGLSENAARAELRDGNAAIFLFSRNGALLTKTMKGGDIISVTGTVAEYYGDDEIIVDSVNHIGSTVMPAPLTASVASLRSRAFQAQRFTIEGSLRKDDSGKRPVVVVQDGTGEMRLITPVDWLLDPKIASAISAGRKATVTGVLSMRKDPKGALYMALVPEHASDLRPLPPSMVMRWVMAGSFAGLLLLVLAMWFSRQRSQRRAAELESVLKKLRESEAIRSETDARFRAAQFAASMATFTFDPASSRFEWSAELGALAWLGDLHEWRNIEPRIQPEQLDRLRSHARRLLASGGDFEEEIELRGVHGETIALLVKGSRTNGRRQISGVVIDVTERRRLQEQLRESQKLEAVGRLAGGIAHDFNNLLTAIHGYSELVMEEDGGLEAKSHVAEILKATREASSLVTQLLTFSRRGEQEYFPLNLNEIVTATLEALKQTLKAGHSIDFEPEQGLEPVLADRGEMEQVLWNLVLNARDAMPQGGEIRVRTDMQEGYIRLGVSDTGEGMDEETRAHMFEPFFTTKDRARGTGLGLAMVYSVVQRMGGHIEVESGLSQGTKISVFLPTVTGEEGPREKGTSRGRKRPANVLIVEDEEPVRRLAASYLARNGFTVWSAENGKEALQLLEEHLEEISLIITDVIMPGMNGRELADAALKRKPSLRVLFMSGYTDQTLITAKVPSAQLLKKPFTLKELVEEAIRTLGEDPVQTKTL